MQSKLLSYTSHCDIETLVAEFLRKKVVFQWVLYTNKNRITHLEQLNRILMDIRKDHQNFECQ